jgi:hypothetical protein
VSASLIAELTESLTALREIATEVQEAMARVRGQPGDLMAVDALAVRLHRLHGCIEDMAYRVSVHINGEVPGGSQSHKEILERTAMEVPGKRRALWRQTPLEDLHGLRKCRHFFRTRYAAKLDRDKVLAVADLAMRVIPLVEQDVLSFTAYLANPAP